MHQPSIVESAFTGVMLELARLRRTDFELPGLRRQVSAVDVSLGALCDAIENVADHPDIAQLAHQAFLAVLALGQMLEGTDSEDRRTHDTLAITRDVIAELLDTLEPYVGHADRELRHVLFGGEPLESALHRLFCA